MTELQNLDVQETCDTTPVNAPRQSIRARAGAAGKALLVYLGSGSVLLAIVAYLVFSGMGC